MNNPLRKEEKSRGRKERKIYPRLFLSINIFYLPNKSVFLLFLFNTKKKTSVYTYIYIYIYVCIDELFITEKTRQSHKINNPNIIHNTLDNLQQANREAFAYES